MANSVVAFPCEYPNQQIPAPHKTPASTAAKALCGGEFCSQRGLAEAGQQASKCCHLRAEPLSFRTVFLSFVVPAGGFSSCFLKLGTTYMLASYQQGENRWKFEPCLISLEHLF